MKSAIHHAYRKASIITDPTQPCLPFAPPPPAHDEQQNAHTPAPKIPTSRYSPHLTPVQLRIARRRFNRNKSLTSDEPTPTPERNVADVNDNQPEQEPPQEQPTTVTPHNEPAQQRRRLRRRIPSPVATQSNDRQAVAETALPESPAQRRPRVVTLHHYWTAEEDKRHLLQGSWRPPYITVAFSLC